MFNSLNRLFTLLFYGVLLALFGVGLWQLGFWPMVIGLVVVALLTWKYLWMAALLGIGIGLS